MRHQWRVSVSGVLSGSIQQGALQDTEMMVTGAQKDLQPFNKASLYLSANSIQWWRPWVLVESSGKSLYVNLRSKKSTFIIFILSLYFVMSRLWWRSLDVVESSGHSQLNEPGGLTIESKLYLIIICSTVLLLLLCFVTLKITGCGWKLWKRDTEF